MQCDICGRINGHAKGCPHYEDTKNYHYYCSICKEPIMDGEEYIMNNNDEVIHFGCIEGIKHLLRFLGYKIEIMNGDE